MVAAGRVTAANVEDIGGSAWLRSSDWVKFGQGRLRVGKPALQDIDVWVGKKQVARLR